MADEKNTNSEFAKEAQKAEREAQKAAKEMERRNEVAKEIEISAKTGDEIAKKNEQRQETEDYLPQEGMFDKMTSDFVKGERPSYEEIQKRVRADVENQPDTQTQDDLTQSGQKL